MWYAGSFALGAVAGALGDKISLAFVQATEQQVEQHLASHLSHDTHGLPAGDTASRAVVTAMQADEAAHSDAAEALNAEIGGSPLPKPMQFAMKSAAKVMTRTAYWV